MIRQLATRMPGAWPQVSSFADLDAKYRIAYRAPADARSTGLPDESVNFIYSTSTLEHIPGADIAKILSECTRIAAPDARLSFIIDYHDHYGTADRSITRWNFYRYTDRQWRKYNPGDHYQNRLRHSDHEKLFANVGLQTISARRIVQPWAEEELARTPVCDEFQYSREDLATTNGYFVLAPAAPRVT
jgi:SAM-dependent methyltransferase